MSGQDVCPCGHAYREHLDGQCCIWLYDFGHSCGCEEDTDVGSLRAEVQRLRDMVSRLTEALKDVVATDLDAARFGELIDGAEKELGS